jgi:hypothetical protein
MSFLFRNQCLNCFSKAIPEHQNKGANMDIFRMLNDSQGTTPLRPHRKGTRLQADGRDFSSLNNLGVLDRAVLTRGSLNRVPSYRSGPTLPLPYSNKALPHSSSFAGFQWNHSPEPEGQDGSRRSVFQVDLRPPRDETFEKAPKRVKPTTIKSFRRPVIRAPRPSPPLKHHGRHPTSIVRAGSSALWDTLWESAP